MRRACTKRREPGAPSTRRSVHATAITPLLAACLLFASTMRPSPLRPGIVLGPRIAFAVAPRRTFSACTAATMRGIDFQLPPGKYHASGPSWNERTRSAYAVSSAAARRSETFGVRPVDGS